MTSDQSVMTEQIVKKLTSEMHWIQNTWQDLSGQHVYVKFVLHILMEDHTISRLRRDDRPRIGKWETVSSFKYLGNVINEGRKD